MNPNEMEGVSPDAPEAEEGGGEDGNADDDESPEGRDLSIRGAQSPKPATDRGALELRTLSEAPMVQGMCRGKQRAIPASRG